MEGALHEYLSEVFPTGTVIQITDTCGGTLGLTPAVAVFAVSLSADDPSYELQRFATERGHWTRQASMQEFAQDHDQTVGISATVLDGKDCLASLGKEALLHTDPAMPGQYFRSNDQTVVIVIPDDTPGQGVLFVQGP
ncbi:hypothetical protein [Tabrizicola sp.]|uniref:hypothetical protein n=1 Tax=Tabrizicola sp. TaxID=2005166 RepID=UPI001A63429F|nr:hypothetical protein [Tabrizicola sp.]MBL9072697.1 hypothetical protein [Tabrizicola sp.]